MSEKTIYVFDDFSGTSPILCGQLFVNHIRGVETYAFQYDEQWLSKTKLSISIDPQLNLFTGRQYPSNNALFGVFSDSSPDRWGRLLINRKERTLSNRNNEKPRKLYDSDYLLGVSDITRMGGLRFKENFDGPFLSNDDDFSVPPWTSLRTIEEAVRSFENDDISFDDKWIKQLINPGSSLGGARPKANIIDGDNHLWIAKFPSKYDEFDVGAWEKVAHDLAMMCGLNVPEARLEKLSQYGNTFLVKRFDRNKEKRIHFASAMTLLEKEDGTSAIDGVSYLDMASFIKSNSITPKNDLVELWKRIVFSMAISNTDDHLQNHAFILSQKGWKLSPMYDVNPIPYGNHLSLNIDSYSNEIDIQTALDVSSQFGINKNDSIEIASTIIHIVKENWEDLASKYHISRNQIEAMRPAFQLSI